MPRTTTRSPADPSEGNERAEVDWKELVELAGRRAIERCRGTPIEPAEIAQEALVRLWLEFDRVRNRRAWLSRVVANLVVSELRRLRVRREALVPGPGSDDSDPAASLLVSVELRGTLARTSHPDLLCLTLYAAGYSHREMAEALGEPVHRVGPRVARALGRLRRKLFRETRPRPRPYDRGPHRYRSGRSNV